MTHINNPNVIEVITSRKLNSFYDVNHKDNFKLGLAVEGGAMKGVVSLGMLMALRDLKMLDLFDIFVGISAGGLNLAHVLAGSPDPLKVYYDFAVDKEVVKPSRIVPGGKKAINLIKLRQLFDDSLTPYKNALKNDHNGKLYVALTDRDDYSGRLLKANSVLDKLEDLLIASATIPGVSTNSGMVNNSNYCDGVFYYCDPFMAAYDLGCTHVLVLNTRTSETVGSESPRQYKYILKILDKVDENLDDLFRTRMMLFHDIYDGFSGGNFRYQKTKGFGVTLQKQNHKVSYLTLNKWELINGAYQGYKAITDLFAKDAEVLLTPKAVFPKTKKSLGGRGGQSVRG